MATNLISGQAQITLSLPVINNAKRISFLATGEEKAPVIASIINNTAGGLSRLVSYIQPDGIFEWYMDGPASQLLEI